MLLQTFPTIFALAAILPMGQSISLPAISERQDASVCPDGTALFCCLQQVTLGARDGYKPCTLHSVYRAWKKLIVRDLAGTSSPTAAYEAVCKEYSVCCGSNVRSSSPVLVMCFSNGLPTNVHRRRSLSCRSAPVLQTQYSEHQG